MTLIKRCSGAFIVNFEHISHLVLVFLLLTMNMKLPIGESICSAGYLEDNHSSFLIFYLFATFFFYLLLTLRTGTPLKKFEEG